MTPNGLTLLNLFCGLYAIILAIKGEFMKAPTFIVLGGIADVLDGRVARATGTGSRFGEELDSLVDAISNMDAVQARQELQTAKRVAQANPGDAQQETVKALEAQVDTAWEKLVGGGPRPTPMSDP